MTVAVRVAASGDRAAGEAALRVWAAAETARLGQAPEPEAIDRVRHTTVDIDDPDGWLLLAEDPDAPEPIVGIARGTAGRAADGAGPVLPGLCHLGLVFVLPERWGQGIGRALVQVALEQARERGMTRIQLWTHESNARARRLYEGLGFTASGRVKDDSYGERIVHYARDLPPLA